jgi:arginine/lysine/ornithine decarboxylase
METDPKHFDMTKAVVQIKGMSGHDVYYALDKKRINIEKYTKQAFIVTIHTNINEQEVKYLLECLLAIADEAKPQQDEVHA